MLLLCPMLAIPFDTWWRTRLIGNQAATDIWCARPHCSAGRALVNVFRSVVLMHQRGASARMMRPL